MFRPITVLINGNFPNEVCLAYLFLRLEKGQNKALYCAVVKVHKASAKMSDKAIEAQYLTRDGFLKLYKTVFGKPVSPATLKLSNTAAKIRDKVIHGKTVTPAAVREALLPPT